MRLVRPVAMTNAIISHSKYSLVSDWLKLHA